MIESPRHRRGPELTPSGNGRLRDEADAFSRPLRSSTLAERLLQQAQWHEHARYTINGPRDTRFSLAIVPTLEDVLKRVLRELPDRVVVTDWEGYSHDVAGEAEHWSGDHLRVHIKEEAAARDLLRLDPMGFPERFRLYCVRH